MFLKRAKKSDQNNEDSNINDNNKKNYEIKKRSNNIVNKNKKNSNDKVPNIKNSNNIPENVENNNSKWNYLTLNNIYFYNNPTDHFDDKNKENLKQNGNKNKNKLKTSNKFYKSYSLNGNHENIESYHLKTDTNSKQGSKNKHNNRTYKKRNTIDLNNLNNYKNNDNIEDTKFEKKNNEFDEIYSDNF